MNKIWKRNKQIIVQRFKVKFSVELLVWVVNNCLNFLVSLIFVLYCLMIWLNVSMVVNFNF